MANENITRAFLDFQNATLDPVPTALLLEFVRLLNAITPSCQYCQSVRDAVASLDKNAELTALDLQESDLSERYVVAPIACRNFRHVSGFTADSQEEALKYFSPE